MLMARTIYYVVLHQGQWKIKMNDVHYGPYETQAKAIAAAKSAAYANARKQIDSQVLVQGGNNQFRTEWTYGKDPFPPAG